MRRLALLAALALLATACGSDGDESDDSSRFVGHALPAPSPAPDFTLADARGDTVTLSAERGKILLVTFLYTRCPDVCPLIAEALNRALGALGPDHRQDVRVLAVSVDPEGDTPARVRSYAAIHRLRPEFRYLVGARRELEPVWRDYDVLAFALDPESEEVEHSAQTLLVDRQGLRRVAYPSDVTTDEVVHDVRVLLER